MPFNRLVQENAYRKIGETLRRLRKQRGYSQEGFAQFAEIERARYGKIERGELNPTWKVLFVLAANLNVTPAELVKDVTVEDCLGLGAATDD